MSDDAIKAQAKAIARMANFESSYVTGEWWTNRFIAVKLPGALSVPLVFDMECQCVTGGCDCTCYACSNCEEQATDCPILRDCPTLVSRWLEQSADVEKIPDRLTALLASLDGVETAAANVTLKLSRNSLALRCVLVNGVCEGFHAQASFLAVARRFGHIDTWRMTRKVGASANALMILGYRQRELTALVMPMARMEACKREPA